MGAGLLASVILAQPTVELSFQDGNLLLKSAGRTLTVSTQQFQAPPMFPADRIALAFGGKEVTFDDKGMGVVTAGGTAYSRFPDMAVSPRAFSQEEIAETQRQTASGQRQAGYSSLSGYEYVGSTLYLLLRWTDKDRKPWLEVLAAIDMAEPVLQPRLAARMPAISYASGMVDDRLALRGGRLEAPAAKEGSWGLMSMALDGGEPAFKAMGPAVGSVRVLEGGARALVQTTTPYGTTLAGLADLDAGSTRLSVEVRGAVRGFLEPRYLRWTDGARPVLTNLETGAELRPAWDTAFAMTSFGLLAWSPALAPERASLMEPEAFRSLANWNAAPPNP